MRALGFIIKTVLIAALPVLIYGAIFMVGYVLSDLGACETVPGGFLECANGDHFGDVLNFAYLSVFFVPPFLFLWVVGVLIIGMLIGLFRLMRSGKSADANVNADS
ncbi:hypothetical protein HK107_01260 [Parvularcula sp. ZS-1/3]|uniref:Uncharacterized protein n=1 Tax=Parvularcula mediterranea TaxID=2732508 RepID=A0A7Y3RJ01_9PROT|nr:hypothetical protein [Parvularcula mediterranea]NNU14950.1 hypothetical protein [Parvularcula mediterranea]